MLFELKKVYLDLNIEKIKTLLLNPKFWEAMVENTKRISITKINSTTLHQEMLLEVEIDSLGVIKRDVETIQDVIFTQEGPIVYEKKNLKIQNIHVHVENSNQLSHFDGLIKIEEKPGKIRLTFTLNNIGLKNSLVELLGYTLTNRRLKRELRKIMEKVFEYSKTNKLNIFF